VPSAMSFFRSPVFSSVSMHACTLCPAPTFFPSVVAFPSMSPFGMLMPVMRSNMVMMHFEASTNAAPSTSSSAVIDSATFCHFCLTQLASSHFAIRAVYGVRALFFIRGMIQALVDDKDVPTDKKKSLKDCVLEGYKDSLAPHHGFMTKGVFQVAVKAAPYRDTFIAKLGDDYNSVLDEFIAIKPFFEKPLNAVLKCLKDNKIEA